MEKQNVEYFHVRDCVYLLIWVTKWNYYQWIDALNVATAVDYMLINNKQFFFLCFSSFFLLCFKLLDQQ